VVKALERHVALLVETIDRLSAGYLRVQQWVVIVRATIVKQRRDADTAATVVAPARNVVPMATPVQPQPTASGTVPGQLDDRELRAWRGMLRVHATLTKALDADLEAEHGLPLSSYEVLLHLADADGQRMRMSDLAASVILSRSGLTRLVDRLEREGLIARESCPSDARGSFATLTSAGRRKLDAARATHLAGVRSMFVRHFSAEELELLGEAWERLLPGVGGVPGPACG
jgi:DNA-binding MarR family transcriptional regulator